MLFNKGRVWYIVVQQSGYDLRQLGVASHCSRTYSTMASINFLISLSTHRAAASALFTFKCPFRTLCRTSVIIISDKRTHKSAWIGARARHPLKRRHALQVVIVGGGGRRDRTASWPWLWLWPWPCRPTFPSFRPSTLDLSGICCAVVIGLPFSPMACPSSPFARERHVRLASTSTTAPASCRHETTKPEEEKGSIFIQGIVYLERR